ncbi:hypothetical protein TWF569_011524 [Orbilia oligospora]|nr:hypothetical protein TWF706_002638 [Orbilia oligospora]KAF3128276.1 hypothetical protein TWF594_011692 [Orbilia oligospora]KAF3130870.1 hypothetical protein TWF569_011524 [Orbilia oligospora]
MEGYPSYPPQGGYPSNQRNNSYPYPGNYQTPVPSGPASAQNSQSQQSLTGELYGSQPSSQLYAHQAYQPPTTRQLRSYTSNAYNQAQMAMPAGPAMGSQFGQSQIEYVAAPYQQSYQPPHPQTVVPATVTAAAHQVITSDVDAPSERVPKKPIQHVNIKTKFPVARIKRIMQADEDVGKVAQVTPVIVAKALELFMVSLVTQAAEQAKARGSKRITAAHLKLAVNQEEQFDFLSDIISKAPDIPTAGEGNGKAAASGGNSDGGNVNIIEEDGAPPKKRRGRKKKVSSDDEN